MKKSDKWVKHCPHTNHFFDIDIRIYKNAVGQMVREFLERATQDYLVFMKLLEPTTQSDDPQIKEEVELEEEIL